MARAGVQKGRGGMSHLELIDITKPFQEDQREARKREEESITTGGETERNVEMRTKMSFCGLYPPLRV